MNRLFRHAVLAASLAVLASCGGGVSQIDAFQPDRLLVFGDEHSLITTAGRKYTVNALNSAATDIDCESNMLWTQSVASLYGFKFANCPVGTADAKAVSRATYGATVAQVTAQVDAQVAQGFTAKDLVVIMAGLHDVKQIYEGRAAGATDESLLAAARQRGVDLATQINRMVSLGAKVIVATAPDLGITPYGKAKGTTQAALLTQLSAAFNGRLRVNILNDGRYIGLVLADEMLQSAVSVPEAYGLTNVKDPVCRTTVPLPGCDNNAASLVDGSSSDTWLWADELHFGTLAHRQIGSLAASRAQSNPF
jgi:phospholipase/lecithinase/hemolysin